MRHLAWGVLGLVTQQVFSQATQADNNGGGTSFLGWNAGAGQILEVKNEANQPIQWFTDSLQRMQLWETQKRKEARYRIARHGDRYPSSLIRSP